jgi:glycosyltransferase involved in cell wall biosynthesis
MSLAANSELSSGPRAKPVVLHLDHSSESGGAELALMRVLRHSETWTPILRIPQNGVGQPSVFDPLKSVPSVTVSQSGKPQKPGASNSGAGIVRMAKFAIDALTESAGLRISSEFRRAGVVHANTSRSAVYGAVACAFTQKKFIVHLRDMTSPDSLGALGFQLFTRVALKRADGVIANSRSTLASAVPFLKPDAVRSVIPSPIGLETRQQPGTPSDEVTQIGMVARIDPWKGHALLLRAFAETCSGTAVRLVLAGGPSFGKDEDLEELRELARSLGIADQVDFLGHVADVAPVIRAVDICVQASVRPEPLGQNVLQYLVAGKPVIAVNAGGPAEWIRPEENGLLVEMNDLASLSAALRRLVDDPALRKQLATGAAATPGIATDVEVAQLHSDAFRSVLTSRNGSGR